MLQDRDVNISDFLTFTSGGLMVADFDQVQAALIRRYKEIYGSDIDLANTTADGVYINDLALIINNMLQAFKTLYANLNVDTASGVYLDSLCRLSNITRKTMTQSTAQLQISSPDTQILASNTKFVDNTGNTWTYNGKPIEFISGTTPTQQITVVCDTYGPIEAPIGSIYQTLENTSFVITQNSAAIPGLDDESDADLRARRAQSTGSTGTTVLQSLVGALMEVNGIEDVQVINNNTDSDLNGGTTPAIADTSTVKEHSVYVIIRQTDGLDLDPEMIGNIIYEKLTPGISTNKFDPYNSSYDSSGVDGDTTSITVPLDEAIQSINQIIYWKQAVPINPSITITITPLDHFVQSTCDLIGNAAIKYLNDIKLSQVPQNNNIIVEAMYADPMFKGRATYTVKSVNTSSAAINPNTYYHYTRVASAQSEDPEYPNDIVITLS